MLSSGGINRLVMSSIKTASIRFGREMCTSIPCGLIVSISVIYSSSSLAVDIQLFTTTALQSLGKLKCGHGPSSSDIFEQHVKSYWDILNLVRFQIPLLV